MSFIWVIYASGAVTQLCGYPHFRDWCELISYWRCMQRNLSGFEHNANTCCLCYGEGCNSAIVSGNLSHYHNCQRYIVSKLLQASTMGLVVRKLDGHFVQHEQYNSFALLVPGILLFLVLLM